jgi:uncharacterized protein (DUF488 family)
MPTVLTIGHSNRSLDAFIELLEAHRVTRLVDVRTVPRSRHNPQFNADAVPRSLAERGIAHTQMRELGGLRKPRSDSMNLGWRNESFRTLLPRCSRWRSATTSRSCAPSRSPGAVTAR